MKNLWIVALIALFCFASVYYKPSTTPAGVATPTPAPYVDCTTIADSDDWHDSVCENTMGGTTTYTRTSFGGGTSSLRQISKDEYDRALEMERKSFREMQALRCKELHRIGIKTVKGECP